ncbi:hypothetical protein HaLaN_22867, partial [Haematococcus lacustris]
MYKLRSIFGCPHQLRLVGPKVPSSGCTQVAQCWLERVSFRVHHGTPKWLIQASAAAPLSRCPSTT